MSFNNEDTLLYRIIVIFTNPKLSAVKLFFFANNLIQKWRQIQIQILILKKNF